jgi:NitT/TauT family transport system permease protein
MFFFGVSVLLIIWQIASYTVPAYILPPPIKVFSNMFQNVLVPRGPGNQPFWYHLSQTLIRVAAGTFISMAIGIGVGIVMGINKYIEDFMRTWVMVGLTIPSLTWCLLGVLWFKIGFNAATFAVVLICAPFVIISIWEGVRNVDERLVEFAKSFGASKATTIRHIFIPQLNSSIFGALRYAFGTAWKIVVIAEIFGLPDGVGYMMNYWYSLFRIDQLLAWTLAFVIVMLALENLVINPIEKKVFAWKVGAKL